MSNEYLSWLEETGRSNDMLEKSAGEKKRSLVQTGVGVGAIGAGAHNIKQAVKPSKRFAKGLKQFGSKGARRIRVGGGLLGGALTLGGAALAAKGLKKKVR